MWSAVSPKASMYCHEFSSRAELRLTPTSYNEQLTMTQTRSREIPLLFIVYGWSKRRRESDKSKCCVFFDGLKRVSTALNHALPCFSASCCCGSGDVTLCRWFHGGPSLEPACAPCRWRDKLLTEYNGQLTGIVDLIALPNVEQLWTNGAIQWYYYRALLSPKVALYNV